jgi:hypothetical protein
LFQAGRREAKFPPNKIASICALRSIFSTQTNDFALGVPIIAALFPDKPEYQSFCYITAPISLMFLNPIGFGVMEAAAVSEKDARNHGMRKIAK